jgi:hypothetical protein
LLTAMREVTGVNVLLLLRDHIANDFQSLCEQFGFNSSATSYPVMTVLKQLNDAGLITQQAASDAMGAPFSGRIEVAPKWQEVQQALGISLKKVAQVGSNSLVVTPYFGPPEPAPINVPLDVFVLMSFDPKFRPLYDDHILKVARTLNLNAKRADDFFTTHHVMSDVWEAIHSARLVIADCTGRNPNVFYEIGVAHTLGRPVVLIAHTDHDVPFDLKANRYIRYDYPEGMEVFERQLCSVLTAELSLLRNSGR